MVFEGDSYISVAIAAKIKSLLRQRGFNGETIKEQLAAAGSTLPHDLKREIRQFMRERNKRAHEDDYAPSREEVARYVESGNAIIFRLGGEPVYPKAESKTNFSAEELELRRKASEKRAEADRIRIEREAKKRAAADAAEKKAADASAAFFKRRKEEADARRSDSTSSRSKSKKSNSGDNGFVRGLQVVAKLSPLHKPDDSVATSVFKVAVLAATLAITALK